MEMYPYPQYDFEIRIWTYESSGKGRSICIRNSSTKSPAWIQVSYARTWRYCYFGLPRYADELCYQIARANQIVSGSTWSPGVNCAHVKGSGCWIPRQASSRQAPPRKPVNVSICLKRIVEYKIFPPPLPGQGGVFDKSALHVAWCIVSSTSDKDEVDKLVFEMQKCKSFNSSLVPFLM